MQGKIIISEDGEAPNGWAKKGPQYRKPCHEFLIYNLVKFKTIRLNFYRIPNPLQTGAGRRIGQLLSLVQGGQNNY